MKKIILSLAMMVISTAAFSQKSIGLFTEFSEPSTIGISYEHKAKADKDGLLDTKIINVGFSQLDFGEKIADKKLIGNGFTIQLGTRSYLDKGSSKGFYAENFLVYSNVKFDETFAGIGNLTGRYSYWSLIDPTFGYRFEIGKIAIDPSIGCIWKWEVKGTGIVDNKNYNNFVFKYGIRLAYKL